MVYLYQGCGGRDFEYPFPHDRRQLSKRLVWPTTNVDCTIILDIGRCPGRRATVVKHVTETYRTNLQSGISRTAWSGAYKCAVKCNRILRRRNFIETIPRC